MLDILIERLRQKKRTVGYPSRAPALLPRFRGRPFIDAVNCRASKGSVCRDCAAVCPSGALSLEEGVPALDMGKCVFCGNCSRACREEALLFTTDWRLASTEREALIIRPLEYDSVAAPVGHPGASVQSLPERGSKSFVLDELPVRPCAEPSFARSFRLRQVTAAGCGACEADLNVLSTVVFDIGRFGMDFVASPRHADGLVLTGPVPRNMREALLKCRKAMAEPRPVVAIGACAISGGLFRQEEQPADISQRAQGAEPHVPVSLFIPGCPPHPYTSLEGLLRFIGREVFSPSSNSALE